jgi:hypothetical protein
MFLMGTLTFLMEAVVFLMAALMFFMVKLGDRDGFYGSVRSVPGAAATGFLRSESKLQFAQRTQGQAKA